ncbi:MAG: hypothetical protein QXS93_02970 [Candidatus Micrarchaeia archaeon]
MQRVTDTIRERFGTRGIKAYSLINGKRTVKQIMSKAKVDEEYILDFMEFLKKRGIIALKHKGKAGKSKRSLAKCKTKQPCNNKIAPGYKRKRLKETIKLLKAKTRKR